MIAVRHGDGGARGDAPVVPRGAHRDEERALTQMDRARKLRGVRAPRLPMSLRDVAPDVTARRSGTMSMRSGPLAAAPAVPFGKIYFFH